MTHANEWLIVHPADVGALLADLGLTAYRDRCDVSQRLPGEFSIRMANGEITVEMKRQLRIVIKTANMLEDITEILKVVPV